MILLAYEMGLKPVEVAEITLSEFNLMLTGYYRRQEHDKNNLRHILAFIRGFGGMGGQDYMSPQQIWPLNMDNEDVKRMVTSLSMAMELLKEF